MRMGRRSKKGRQTHQEVFKKTTMGRGRKEGEDDGVVVVGGVGWEITHSTTNST